MCEKGCIWNPCTYENGKHLRSVIGESVITCNEIVEVTKTVPTKTLYQKLF